LDSRRKGLPRYPGTAAAVVRLKTDSTPRLLLQPALVTWTRGSA
jgi:hypothetical protein